jgi:uncharacterized protein YdhG (YjbR/CyaY superfamily)
MGKPAPKSFDQYVKLHPEPVRRLLVKMREAIQRSAPKATETISYGMPAFAQDGILVWFAAHKSHIGFYPRVAALVAFKKDLAAYKSSKGAVQFPFDEPLPLGLVSRIVRFRLQQNQAKKKNPNRTARKEPRPPGKSSGLGLPKVSGSRTKRTAKQ